MSGFQQQSYAAALKISNPTAVGRCRSLSTPADMLISKHIGPQGPISLLTMFAAYGTTLFH